LPELRRHGLDAVRSRRRTATAVLGGCALLTATAIAVQRSTGQPMRGDARARPVINNHAAASERPASPVRHSPRRPGSPRKTELDLPRLVGQLLVGRFDGPEPSASFLDRIRAGQLGSVILFADNTSGGLDATRLMVGELQSAAREGGNPPLLVMTDQEGGDVRRLPGAPELAPADITSDSVARSEGQAAGELLRSVGVNVDLAPVADVESTSGSFLGARSFGSDPAQVASRACAFASGLTAAGVAYTLKHFPGLGRATASTDTAPVSIPDSPSLLRADCAAYEMCGANPNALIMVSSAIYPTLTGPLPAVMSPSVYQRELPIALGRPDALTISDDVQAPALAPEPSPALRSIDAGLDLAMYATSESGSATAYSELLAGARSGSLPLDRLLDAVKRIQTLKRMVVR
jgi:beta-N-acetylhexosaminidase